MADQIKISEAKAILESQGYTLARSKKNNNEFFVEKKGEPNSKKVYRRSQAISMAMQMASSGNIDLNAISNNVSASRTPRSKRAVVVVDSMAAKSIRDRFDKITLNGGDTVKKVEDLISESEINYDISIPKHLEGFYFDPITGPMLARVKRGLNCFISGAAGSGKSQLVMNLAKLLEQKVVRVNFSVGTTEQHLIGRWMVKNGETVFNYGILPLAMKNGWWILFDEMDYAMPEHLSILQPVLEGENLMMTQHENEEIIPHHNFRIFATGNTKGRGDATQSYIGTNNLNLAFLDRWAIFEIDYTTRELEIVNNIIKDEKMSEDIVKFFQVLRAGAEEGAVINSVFSTRRLISLAEALIFGDSLKDALEYELFSRYDKHEVNIMKEFAYDVWPREHYMKGWKLGDPHHVDPSKQSTMDNIKASGATLTNDNEAEEEE